MCVMTAYLQYSVHWHAEVIEERMEINYVNLKQSSSADRQTQRGKG